MIMKAVRKVDKTSKTSVRIHPCKDGPLATPSFWGKL